MWLDLIKLQKTRYSKVAMLLHDFTLYTLLLVTHINLSYSSLSGFLVPKNQEIRERHS